MLVKINGLEQRVSIHGADATRPALLLVNGAGVALSRIAAFFRSWESAFRIVHWDQPTMGTITFDRLAADGVAVADAVCDHLGLDTLILLATSAGSIVGLKMIKARPDRFSAYVGTGQIVLGRDVTESSEGLALTPAEQAAFAELPRTGGDQRAEATRMYEQLKNEMAAFDARALGLDYAVPMYFIQGDRDRYTPTTRVAAFEAEISAPRKSLIVVEGGGHAVMFMRDAFLAALTSAIA
ncbi:MAG TPA: alpha/beta hydrolase [Vicinamibacterales bacterium]|nr:alpha/beta hydrolase [Vicinamibacterales bacterium]